MLVQTIILVLVSGGATRVRAEDCPPEGDCPLLHNSMNDVHEFVNRYIRNLLDRISHNNTHNRHYDKCWNPAAIRTLESALDNRKNITIDGLTSDFRTIGWLVLSNFRYSGKNAVNTYLKLENDRNLYYNWEASFSYHGKTRGNYEFHGTVSQTRTKGNLVLTRGSSRIKIEDCKVLQGARITKLEAPRLHTAAVDRIRVDLYGLFNCNILENILNGYDSSDFQRAIKDCL